MNSYFVTGIGTGIGKTVAAAVCAEALGACYWKPVQAGDIERSDSKWVAAHTASVDVLPERFQLTQPMSPHAAAAIDGCRISLSDFELPDIGMRSLIVEGAGGVLVPINEKETIADVIVHLGLPVLLVSQSYLGSINHTLLTIEALRQREVVIAGLIFNGTPNTESERIIEKQSGLQAIGRIPLAPALDTEFVVSAAEPFRGAL